MASKWAQLEPVMTVIWAKPLLQQGHPNKHNHNTLSKSGGQGLCFYPGAQHVSILLHLSNNSEPEIANATVIHVSVVKPPALITLPPGFESSEDDNLRDSATSAQISLEPGNLHLAK